MSSPSSLSIEEGGDVSKKKDSTRIEREVDYTRTYNLCAFLYVDFEFAIIACVFEQES